MPVGTIRCSVCRHPRAREIDLWIRPPAGRGQPRSRTAVQFDVSEAAIARHVGNGHWKAEADWASIDRSLARARAAADVPPAASGDDEPFDVGPVDGLGQLEKMLGALAATDTRGWSPRDLNQHNDQLRRTAESVARLKPPADREGPAQAQTKVL